MWICETCFCIGTTFENCTPPSPDLYALKTPFESEACPRHLSMNMATLVWHPVLDLSSHPLSHWHQSCLQATRLVFTSIPHISVNILSYVLILFPSFQTLWDNNNYKSSSSSSCITLSPVFVCAHTIVFILKSQINTHTPSHMDPYFFFLY